MSLPLRNHLGSGNLSVVLVLYQRRCFSGVSEAVVKKVPMALWSELRLKPNGHHFSALVALASPGSLASTLWYGLA